MVNTVSLGYVGSAKVARLSSLRVAAEPGPRYRASGAAAARPGGRLAQPPLPPEAAYVGLGLRCGGSTMCTDIALRRRALHTAPRRSQRGHLYFHHGLLASTRTKGARSSRGRARPSRSGPEAARAPSRAGRAAGPP